MKNKWTIIAVLSILPLWSGSATAEEDEDERAIHPPYVIETFDAGAYQYQLVVTPCVERLSRYGHQETECPIVVNLLKEGKRVDSQELPLPAYIPILEHKYIWPKWGAMLYNHNPAQKVWSFGYEYWHVSLLPKLVKLDDKQNGLLVTQHYGFEVLNDEHVLYTEYKGKLQRIWSHAGLPPPYQWSEIYPVTADGKPYLLFWRNSPDDQTTKHEAYLLRWNSNKKTVEPIALPTADIPLYAVAIEFYDSDEEETEIACKRNSELHDTTKENYTKLIGIPYVETYILSTRNYPGLPQDKKMMSGNVFFSLEEARKLQQGLKDCEPSTDSEIIELNGD